jgi:pyrroloquinoline quinone (PQQ) biosynthesis protein C
MRVVVDPPVDEPLRQVLAEALRERATHEVRASGYDDAWRRAALQDGVERDEVESSYAPSPRSTRGATRA